MAIHFNKYPCLPEDAPEVVQAFWREVDQATMELADKSGGQFLNLVSGTWFNKGKSLESTMYVRKCYIDMWCTIWEKNKMGTSRFGILGKGIPRLLFTCIVPPMLFTNCRPFKPPAKSSFHVFF